MTDLLFLAGLVAAVVGIALVSVPAALVVGGLTTSAVAYTAHRPAPPQPQPEEGDE